MAEIEQLAVFVDRIIVVALRSESVPEVPAGGHFVTRIQRRGSASKIEPFADRSSPIAEGGLMSRLALAVAVHIFAEQSGSIARGFEPYRQLVLLIIFEGQPAATSLRLV